LGVLAAGLPGQMLAAAEKVPPAPPPVKTFPLKLGLASYSVRKFDLDKCIEMTKRAGLEYLCLKSMHLPLDAKPDEIKAATGKIAQAGLKLYGGGVITMKKEAEVDQAFEYAKAAGMKVIVAMPLPEVLPLVNQKVQQYDIHVAIHNHGPGDKVWPAPKTIYEAVKGLDRRVGICMDIGHTVRIGEDLIDSTQRYADRIFDLHIKDVTDASPKGRGIEVGRGVIDIPRFLQTLIRINYRGVVSFEYEENADDPLPGIAESVGYTKGVLATLAK